MSKPSNVALHVVGLSVTNHSKVNNRRAAHGLWSSAASPAKHFL